MKVSDLKLDKSSTAKYLGMKALWDGTQGASYLCLDPLWKEWSIHPHSLECYYTQDRDLYSVIVLWE